MKEDDYMAVEAGITLSPELENALKAAINKAAKEIVADSRKKDDKWPLYMNKGQAAAFLGISRNTLDDWLATGEIPYKHIGSSYRFNRNDLRRFMLAK